MIRFFLFLLFFSHEVIASVTGKTLICDNNTMGYHFISEKKVNVLSINLDVKQSVKHIVRIDNVTCMHILMYS